MKDIKDKFRRATLIGMAIAMTATSSACSIESDNMCQDQEVSIVQKVDELIPYQRLQKLRQTKLPTYVDTYK